MKNILKSFAEIFIHYYYISKYSFQESSSTDIVQQTVPKSGRKQKLSRSERNKKYKSQSKRIKTKVS